MDSASVLSLAERVRPHHETASAVLGDAIVQLNWASNNAASTPSRKCAKECAVEAAQLAAKQLRRAGLNALTLEVEALFVPSLPTLPAPAPSKPGALVVWIDSLEHGTTWVEGSFVPAERSSGTPAYFEIERAATALGVDVSNELSDRDIDEAQQAFFARRAALRESKEAARLDVAGGAL